ncbi:hypothetical protein V491_02058 [Pseudogymnoascus sp. VKM F-3775]|nr:hypothetical protein V491_02058 [Pseudogymnoascus sp. VKM F-3775]
MPATETTAAVMQAVNPHAPPPYTEIPAFSSVLLSLLPLELELPVAAAVAEAITLAHDEAADGLATVVALPPKSHASDALFCSA